jgi:hypothetical protein
MMGDDDADSLTGLLKKKMAFNSQIHLLGCSTVGIEARYWNPIGGAGLLMRMIMYHGLQELTGPPTCQTLGGQSRG